MMNSLRQEQRLVFVDELTRRIDAPPGADSVGVVMADRNGFDVVSISSGTGRLFDDRMAPGARIQQVVAFVVWGIGPGPIGLTLGLAGAIAGGRIIAGVLFGVQPHDPLTFAGVTLLLLTVVGLACIVPAGRAGRIPPASALRAE